MTIDYAFEEPEDAPGYPCTCSDCHCSEEVDYAEEVCTACQLGSHEDDGG